MTGDRRYIRSIFTHARPQTPHGDNFKMSYNDISKLKGRSFELQVELTKGLPPLSFLNSAVEGPTAAPQ